MLNEKSNRIYSILEENNPIEACTISKTLSLDNGYSISIFSMAKGTTIFPEFYTYYKFLWNLKGCVLINDGKTFNIEVKTSQALWIFKDSLVGIEAIENSIFLEINMREDSIMNQTFKPEGIFSLKDLLPYQEGKIVNMDIIKEKYLKFALMSFDAGTGLSEHAAPGEALVFALDGEAIIGYEGKEYVIHAGENFKFEKMGRHFVKAEKKFKMALLLQLDQA